MSLDVRLAELAALPRGWYDGRGLPIAPGCLATARDLVMQLRAAALPEPALCPSSDCDGGIECEWPAAWVTLHGDDTVSCCAVGAADLDLLHGDVEAVAAWLRGVLA